MTYQHQTIGRSSERDDLAMVVTSTFDPRFGVRPTAALVDESQELRVKGLRRRVAAARPLLADRPESPTSRLQEVQLRWAELLGYQADEQVALAAATNRRDEATGRGAKAARQAAQEAIDEHHRPMATAATVWATPSGNSLSCELPRAPTSIGLTSTHWWSPRARPPLRFCMSARRSYL
jgi:hypothetical protein